MKMSPIHVTSVEVFDVFRTMSSDMDAQDKPFSFEIVKVFMEKVTELGMLIGRFLVLSVLELCVTGNKLHSSVNAVSFAF